MRYMIVFVWVFLINKIIPLILIGTHAFVVE